MATASVAAQHPHQGWSVGAPRHGNWEEMREGHSLLVPCPLPPAEQQEEGKKEAFAPGCSYGDG